MVLKVGKLSTSFTENGITFLGEFPQIMEIPDQFMQKNSKTAKGHAYTDGNTPTCMGGTSQNASL